MTRIIESLLGMLDVDPALIGDLVEQHARGRSTGWFVRQGVIAAGSTCVRAWTSHKVLALRSLAVGAAAAFLLSEAAWFPVRAACRLFGLTVGNYLLEAHHEVLRQMFMNYHLYDLPFVASTCIVYCVAGWLVARSLREHRLCFVVLFAMAVEFWWGYGLVARYQDAALVPRANLYPYVELLAFFFIAPSIVLGGLRAAQQTRSLPSP